MKTIDMYASGWRVGNSDTNIGAGVVLVYGDNIKEISKYVGYGTVNSCFLSAITIGLEALSEPYKVNIFCHNQIIVNGANKQNEARTNLELWVEYRYQELIHDVTMQWIKKDSHEHNTRSSTLAKKAARY